MRSKLGQKVKTGSKLIADLGDVVQRLAVEPQILKTALDHTIKQGEARTTHLHLTD